MNRSRIIPLAMLALASGALAVTPSRAAAQDCSSRYIQCIMENGGSTLCIHEYIRCWSQMIVES